MAKSGPSSTPSVSGAGRSAETRRRLVDAAIATLKREGFVGASARAIADEAGLNQSLVFYHFGSVADLLLAALDAVSEERFSQYETAVSGARSLTELVDAATDIFRMDLDAGHITVLVEMIAGASTSPELGREVATRIRPWQEFAQRAIEQTAEGSVAAAIPAADVAYAIAALYLGLEMLSNLDGNRQPALELFAHARRLAGVVEGLVGPFTTEGVQ